MADNTMLLIEKQIVRPSNPLYKELDHLCFLSKNLYNSTLYTVRQHYFNTSEYLTAFTVIKDFTKENQVDFRALPAVVARYTVQLVDQNMRAFFALIKKKKAGKYTEPVRLPKYLDKTSGRQVVHYPKQSWGLFRSKEGYKYNADINGSLNILRKYLTNQNAYTDKLHEELVVHMTNPRKLKVASD